MIFSVIIAMYALISLLISLLLLNRFKRLNKKAFLTALCEYALVFGIFMGMFAVSVTPWHFLLVFAFLMFLKPAVYSVICQDYPFNQTIMLFAVADIAGLMGTFFILIVPAMWDFLSSTYLLLYTFVPVLAILGYLIYKKQLTSGKAAFVFIIYPAFSLFALILVLSFGLTRSLFSGPPMTIDPAVLMPVFGLVFLLAPAVRALIYKYKYKDLTFKEAMTMFYAVDISSTVAATLIWLVISYIFKAPQNV
ncbi:hypothetical protein Dip518_000889 [Parelusimicrobium proximum]|uniref:hypothetical protein n=1 Tax=Parelusimicrobium proximum TaxID=3228953 RepID=UPI003D18620D